jgi:hypothetical protein
MTADLRATEKQMKKALHRAAVRGIRRVTEEIDKLGNRKPVDRGIYRAAWKALATDDGAVLFNDSPHAGFIEQGTRPHMPPIEPLKAWVLRKFGPTLRREFKAAGGAKVLGKPMKDYAETAAAALAFAIAKSIARKGTAPRYILQNSIPDLEALAVEELKRVIDAA